MPALGSKAEAAPSNGTKPAAGSAAGGGRSDGSMGGDILGCGSEGGERLEGSNHCRDEEERPNLGHADQKGRIPGRHDEKGQDLGRDNDKGRVLRRHGEEPGSGRARHSPPKIFRGMRIGLLGLIPRATNKLKKLISDMGGVAVSPSNYDTSTHFCLQGDIACRPKIVTEEWIYHCCQQNTLLEYDEVSSENQRRLLPRRFGDEEEEIKGKFHQLFLCEADMTPSMTNFLQVLDGMKTKVHTVITPGGNFNHKSTTTDDYIKIIVRKIYILLKRLSAAGYSLGGNFSACNFVIDEAKGINVRLAFLRKGLLQQSYSNGDELDMCSLEKMVRREVFSGEEIMPHDLNLWLSLLGEKDIEDLLPSHASLMSISRCSESYTTWYDEFVKLNRTRTEDYEKIVDNLSEYNGWKAKVNGDSGNSLLQGNFELSGLRNRKSSSLRRYCC